MASEQSITRSAGGDRDRGRDDSRKLRGAWYTPPLLVDLVVDAVMTQLEQRFAQGDTPSTISVVDPACGDGRFLTAMARRLSDRGIEIQAIGCDIDEGALTAVDPAGCSTIDLIHADALAHDWGPMNADVVIGNPPFLSQMAANTTRGGSSRHGGGPYADAAVEFLSLSHRLANDNGGLVALVLPQSILAARDAEQVRRDVGAQSETVWSWWEPSQRHFDASVNVCALVQQRRSRAIGGTRATWSSIITSRLGVPALDTSPGGGLATSSTIDARAHLNANFRDEYYALVDAVLEDDGISNHPPLVTSGLIDPGRSWWGTREVRFAKQRWTAPVVDVSRLSGRFPAWAERKLQPKVLVANQTAIIEAVADPEGRWLPGVPVTTVTPADPADVWPIAAVLTSPIASAAAWHLVAGTGLSTRSIRIGPDAIGQIPWPNGDVGPAVSALQAGNVEECGRQVQRAFGNQDQALFVWWRDLLVSSPR